MTVWKVVGRSRLWVSLLQKREMKRVENCYHQWLKYKKFGVGTPIRERLATPIRGVRMLMCRKLEMWERRSRPFPAYFRHWLSHNRVDVDVDGKNDYLSSNLARFTRFNRVLTVGKLLTYSCLVLQIH